MATVTGKNGELRFGGVRVAKCRSFSLNVSKDALEDTGLGDYDRTYVPGLRGASGDMNVIYRTDDTATMSLMNAIFSDSDTPSGMTLVLNAATGRQFAFSAIITSMGVPVAVGDVTACSMSFTVTGPVTPAL